MRATMIGHLTLTKTGWIPYHPPRPPASKGTQMSHMTQDTLLGTRIPQNMIARSREHRIPPRVLPPEETQALFEAGHDTTPDLIYAIGVPDTPDPATPT